MDKDGVVPPLLAQEALLFAGKHWAAQCNGGVQIVEKCLYPISETLGELPNLSVPHLLLGIIIETTSQGGCMKCED